MFGFRKSIPHAIKAISVEASSAESQFTFQRNSIYLRRELINTQRGVWSLSEGGNRSALLIIFLSIHCWT